MRDMNRLLANRATRLFPAAVAIAGGLALSACATAEKGPDIDSQTSSAAASGTANANLPQFRFDRRNGGSTYIQVYKGPGQSEQDREPSGIYRDGDVATVQCHALGRLVLSHPEVGEASVKSDQWYRLDTPAAADTQYATAVYGELLPSNAPVPECQDVTFNKGT